MKTLRIWFGCALGLALSMLFDWSYGFFAIMLPLFMLGKMDKFSFAAHAMVFVSAVWTTLQATFLIELFQSQPVLLTVMVGIMMLVNCIAMMKPTTYLFGFVGLFVGSIVLSFASYDFIDIEDFNVNLWVITVANIGVCALAYYLFPEQPQSTREKINTPVKQDKDYTAQVALGWVVVMVAFIVFQVADLYDSLSALASIIILLTPMTLAGSMGVAKIRIIGTGLGCMAGAAVQISLGRWFGNGMLFWLAFTIAMGWFCHWQTKGEIKSAIGFSAMSALAVPLTTSLVPEQQDAFFSILYRFSSIFVAVTLTVMLIWVVHHWLRVCWLR
ncbi:DUF2955 domain-containing protein [Photobacterium sanctipauli]|uniref:DUF2955 domain-containing protein n=1 Tax=Photobacterium sanctipauli TaxID=1342794 RepID=A0A2T3NPK7_9GAMM|nr:DUF2955 domain-containing protein [Photobacterium sanctipauli]PSW18203.1 DUF2955 domain-containing protein [Photobacterium sanctipauli]